jgi:hypothetical protein
MGFPGDDEVEIEAPPTTSGTLESWRLDDDEDRCSSTEDDMESERALFDSRIFWNLERAADVRFVEASEPDGSVAVSKLLRFFFESSILTKSAMLSSSVGTDPELPPGPASFKIPDPGWADEMLPLPLLPSSSVLLAPPDESLPFRWLKLLAYLVIGAGLGEPEAEDAIAFSGTADVPLKADWGTDPTEFRDRACASEPSAAVFPRELREGEGGGGGSISFWAGDADNEGALKGLNDTDGRLLVPEAPSTPRKTAFDSAMILWGGRCRAWTGGEGESWTKSLASRRAEIGLELVGGPTWWKVDRLPYAWVRSAVTW